MNIFLFAWLIISIAAIAIALIVFLYIKVNAYLDIHYRMGIYADIPTSLKNQAIYLNLVNAKNFEHFWNIHEDQLKLYAMGSEIKAIFYKTSDVPGGYKIAYSSVLSNVEILSMIESMKYNTLEVSYDNGITKVHINSLHDKASQKIARKLEEAQLHSSQEQKEEILNKIISAGKIDNEHDFAADNRIISHVNEGRTTGTTMRFQAIIPPHHPLIEKQGFNPESEVSRIYHIYEGHCYLLKCKFIGKIDNLYEWDIVDLEPGTIYAGLTFSIDEGKTLLPSSALYGITKDKRGQLPTIDDAILAKPRPDQVGLEMWDEKAAFDYMGESLTHKTYAILVKKHYEDEYSEEYLALNRTHEFYDDYEWLKLGQATKELHSERNRNMK